jgi:signal transduction histidine kinase
LIDEIFFLENSEQIEFPVGKLLFFPDGQERAATPEIPPSILVQAIQMGQQYEFEQKRYQNALASYEQSYALASKNQIKGEMLNAIARVQRKTLQFQDAIKSYERIIQEYGQTRTANGMPLGLAARLELGSLFLATHDSLRAIRAFVGLYEHLIQGEWSLEESQYHFFSHEVRESIERILSHEGLSEPIELHQDAFQMLAKEEKTRREITQRLLVFKKNAPGNLSARIARSLGDSPDPARRFTEQIGDHVYQVSLLGDMRRENQASRFWGLLLNTAHLRAGLLELALGRYASSENVGWIVKGKNRENILASQDSPSGRMTIKTNFVRDFPNWSLEFYQRDPNPLESLLTSRRSVYFYIFLLLAGILIFGLSLTIRSVTHELALAKMKSDFVSTVSHEFKSPLTAIRQLAEMLKTNRVPSEERRQQYYDVLLEQSERLSLQIDNILDLSKMEAGRREFKFEIIEFGPLLQEIISSLQHRVRHEGMVIQERIGNSLPAMKLDREAIGEAVTNLIDNAMKYSGESKKVTVRAFVENQHVIIAVQDFGIGISKKEVDKVFERFYRGGNSLTRSVKGSGLGLTLVKQIAEAHQGTAHVESELGCGSTFSLRLPLTMRKES